LRIDPVIVRAAAKVPDGQVVAEPVPVGGAFVIVQRRGSRQTPQRTVDTEAPIIRRKLAQARYEQQVTELLAELRKTGVREKQPERVDVLSVSLPHGDIVPVRRPGGLERARHPAGGSPRPTGRPGQLR
jgi:hypothetical protein